MRSLLKPFRGLATTPHILAETSNFIDQAPKYRRRDLVETFRRFIQLSDEHHEAAARLADRDEFSTLGLSDTGLLSLSVRFTVITMDFQLEGNILKAGGSVINFQHIRNQRIRPST